MYGGQREGRGLASWIHQEIGQVMLNRHTRVLTRMWWVTTVWMMVKLACQAHAMGGKCFCMWPKSWTNFHSWMSNIAFSGRLHYQNATFFGVYLHKSESSHFVFFNKSMDFFFLNRRILTLKDVCCFHNTLLFLFLLHFYVYCCWYQCCYLHKVTATFATEACSTSTISTTIYPNITFFHGTCNGDLSFFSTPPPPPFFFFWGGGLNLFLVTDVNLEKVLQPLSSSTTKK